MNVLEVNNLGKAYRQFSSEWKRVLSWFNFPLRPVEEHWVLRNINFSIVPGEAVGIVGQNGAGKSTLLKMITGTQQPTEGDIRINGRISAILELGMGFNPEFTGRQNACHGLGLMGFNQLEIESVMPDVSAFAEIGEYFDQPVRTYSSGMQMRVAFAVATAFRPDILIVDEALSVGDAAFQRKCFRRIETYINKGMALLLVSHDIESIKKTCVNALFLNNGSQLKYGDAKEICDDYEQHLLGGKNLFNEIDSAEDGVLLDPSLLSVNELSYGDGRAEIEKVWFENNSAERVNIINTGEYFNLKFQVRFDALIRYPVFAFLIKTMEGISLYGTDTILLKESSEIYDAGDRVVVAFKIKNHLAVGTYFINCGIRDECSGSSIFIHRIVDAALFKVKQAIGNGQVGMINLDASYSSLRI